ncbi:MAG: TetR/AcrR family transcriptional regulator [Oscillospiraceae bacterium]|nr:TetR/AcrR family transcriptional regulator [Oscillospiraceae bacterium]
MRKFLSLPQEKQNRIVDAAMTLFGEVGYKKAYISEIASDAGISKALIFHYFGSKKGLYSYLVYYTGKIVMTEAQHERDTANKDFIDRALTTIKFRLSLKNRYPAMNAFIESVYNEDEPEVEADIERLKAIATDMHSKVELSVSETAYLRQGVDPALVMDLVEKYTEGIVYEWHAGNSIDDTMAGVHRCLDMLKRTLFN